MAAPNFVCAQAAAADVPMRRFTVSSDTLVGEMLPGDFQEFVIYQNNVSSVPIRLGWQRIEVDTTPSSWVINICDLGQCYAGIPDARLMDTLAAGDQAFLKLSVTPGLAGYSEVRVYVYDLDYPNAGDTITWQITSVGAGVSAKETVQHTVAMPNPTSRLVTMTLPEAVTGTLRVTNVGGTVVMEQPLRSAQQAQVDLGSLPSGDYFIEARSDKGERVLSRVVKN